MNGDQMSREKGSYSVQCVENALELLESLTGDNGLMTVTSLAFKLKLSRNKTFRLLATLEERGLVERDEISGNYRIGLSAVELAHKLLKSVNLIQLARPVMERLAREHDEAVYLTVLQGDEVLFLDMVDSEQQVKAAPLLGKRFPFFTNAAGKAIRAVESRDLLERLSLRSNRKGGIPDFAKLEAELNTIRSKGVAVDLGGLGDGIITVAVAVRDYAGKVVGALTLLRPSFRLLTDRLENEIIPSLREGADLLSIIFGYAR